MSIYKIIGSLQFTSCVQRKREEIQLEAFVSRHYTRLISNGILLLANVLQIGVRDTYIVFKILWKICDLHVVVNVNAIKIQ